MLIYFFGVKFVVSAINTVSRLMDPHKKIYFEVLYIKNNSYKIKNHLKEYKNIYYLIKTLKELSTFR